MDQPQAEHSEDDTLVAVSDRLVQTSIEQARQALNRGSLEEAHRYFGEALEVEGQHPRRTSMIREELKRYSDQLATQRTPPDWDNAYLALDMLEDLALNDAESEKWRTSLALLQADRFMDAGDLDSSFAILGELMEYDQPLDESDELKAQISDIVRRNVLNHARQHQWDSLREIIKRFTQIAKPILPPGDELSEWVETLSGTLEAISQADEQAQRQLEAEQRRRRMITYILTGIALVMLAINLVTVWIGA
jgi:hypothetical protein